MSDIPSLHQLIRSSAAHPAHASSVLADAHQRCAYPQLPGFLDAIQQFLGNAGAQRGDCITVELSSSLPSALTVLALLDAEHSFSMLPLEGLGARAASTEIPAPRFAKWILSVRADASRRAVKLSDPADFLRLRTNPDYQPAPSLTASGPPRLYGRTSGSLGAAKLAVRHYSRLIEQIPPVIERLRLESSHRIALPIPIFHLYGLGVAFLPALVAGASIDLQERANLLSFLEREESFEPNAAFMTPTFCEALLRARKAPRPYRFIVTGGDCISESARTKSESVHGPLINAYGCTELGLIAISDVGMPAALRSGTVGRPLPDVEVRFIEREGGTELQVRRARAFDGYVDLNGNELQVPATFDGEWYCTKDLSAPGAEGTLRILGRCDLSVNRNGMLLPFGDVESRLRAIEGVEDAAVAAGPEDIRGRALVAFCVVPKGRWSSQGLRARYAERAPAFAVPDTVCIVDVLPKLANGKLDRRRLATMAQHASEQQA